MERHPSKRAEEIVLVKNLGADFMRQAHEAVSFFTVAFVDHRQDDASWKPKLLGSGVLVSAGKTKAILTAHHVIENVEKNVPKDRRLCILLEKTDHPHTIDPTSFTVRKLARGSRSKEGPDIGAVVLAPTIAGAIGAKKAFFNLDKWRDSVLNEPPGRHDGVWITQGFVDQWTRRSVDADGGQRTGFFQFGGFGGPEELPHDERGWDYFDFPIELKDVVEVPTNWGGMSGGGVWQVPLKKVDDQIQAVYPAPILSGVMFYQHPPTATSSAARSHGRKSVYERVYGKLFEPK